ncbi:MAG TPA: NADP-dependent isocitrate dehydrogenase [Anaerolineae bacterium]|nr:NADP-dependent isocitrate dehydrogenase [Anaerolineae bacterium]
MSHRVTLIPGDGVGPEISLAARRVIEAAGVAIEWEEAEAGAEVFKRGDTSGVPKATAESIARTGVALKGPLETPVGFGEKSANVTLRKLFETYANIRPARQLPGVPTRYDGEGIDFIVVRENIEDLYAGVEYLDTRDVAVALKIITRRGSEKIIRYAFELARREGRHKVTCATKANILKLTEGMFKRVFEEMAPEYPEIEPQHLIIDNVAHQMVKDPAQFDVIVTTNLAGDIISDLASGLVGGLGFAASGNYGDEAAIFEAVHGSAPKYAGKNVINPTALILSSVMMLRHLGERDAAQRIEDAVFVTLEEGQAVTLDVARQAGDVEHATSTSGFADAIIENLGRAPQTRYATKSAGAPSDPPEPRKRWPVGAERAAIETRLIGADVYTEAYDDPAVVGRTLDEVAGPDFRLLLMSARGTMVYPTPSAGVDTVGWWRCRFVAAEEGATVDDAALLRLLERIGARLPWMHVQKLRLYGDEEGFTKAQGQ